MSNAKNNSTKTVLITGATSGIGYELSKLFAQDGYNLIIVARTEADLENLSEELTKRYQIKVMSLPKDLFEPNASYELYREVKAKGIEINILVNNAGQGQFGVFTEQNLDRIRDIIQLNVVALTELTHLFLRDMVKRNEGKILQLASIASQLPGPWQAVYHATKAFVLSLTEALISELKGTNVTLTILQPGATKTDFFAKANMQSSKILNTDLANPEKVAKDGYRALMAGDRKVVSGLLNKVTVMMSNFVPSGFLADQVKNQQKPIS